MWKNLADAQEAGGWPRQANVKDLRLATEVAAANLRLTAGGVRELHWHAAAEWSLMLSGSARLTAIDNQGSSYVEDVHQSDLWYSPTGVPHSTPPKLVMDHLKISEETLATIPTENNHVVPAG